MDLIELLLTIEEEEGQQPNARNPFSDEPEDDECIILVLDENLQRFPFEGMPILEGKTVCRVPCLTFVLSKFQEMEQVRDGALKLDPTNTSFVLDPERNLQGTRKRILPELEHLQAKNHWEWESVIGEMPTTEFFESGLTKENSLFMYFGHGGAQSCFSRRRIEDLIARRTSRSMDAGDGKCCRATVVLMGCSSGRLESINRKSSDLVEETPLYYEPVGVALSYLCAGSPCVVGNLWDVTDHDIDRFSVDLLHHFLGGLTAPSLPKSVRLSRTACKLRYLVGCAPVCYGLPIYARSGE